MNILFVAATPPWPTWGGASLRTYHFLRLLSTRHRLYLLCPASVREELQLKEALSPWCQRVLCVPPSDPKRLAQRALAVPTSPVPDLVVRMRQPALRAAVRQLLRERVIDLVHVVGLEAAASLFPLDDLEEDLGDTPIVLDALNAEYLLQERAWRAARTEPALWPRAAYSWLQAQKLRFYEAAVGKRVAGILATSPEDKEALEELVSYVPVGVVASGVDTVRYRPPKGQVALPRPSNLPYDGPLLLFTGTMDYRPNIDAVEWFVSQALPSVRERVANTHFVVMGRSPAPEVLRLAGSHITVTGEVEDDLPYFHGADLFVLPMRFGGGTRLKLLQAMACGLPVVTTTMGASGTAFRHGEHGLVADTADAFAEAVVTLFHDPALAHRLSLQALGLALAGDWALRLPALESFYREVTRVADAKSGSA